MHENGLRERRRGVGPVKAMLIDDAASDYEHRISTLGLV